MFPDRERCRSAVVAAAIVTVLIAPLVGMMSGEARADAAFRAWIETLRPEAEAAGVSRATFDAAFKGLEPDLTLPDLLLPGAPQKADSTGQAEFTRPPSAYLDRTYLTRLAADGKVLLVKHKDTLDKIERDLGVDRYSVLAIWGRESAFGTQHDGLDVIRSLATLSYTGRRKEMFRTELIAALRMLEVGVPRSKMKGSWAGAMGLTQFMPTEYFKHAHDLDKNGSTDIWNSVPDALASAARQLQGKGWVRGETWGYEVKLSPNADCSLEGPTQARPISEWAKLGIVRVGNRPWTEHQLALEAYMMSPAGAYGPSFLVLENFKVIRLYNTSDLYALFVGNLADRLAGGGDFATPWTGTAAQKTSTIEEIQQRLKAAGYEVEKIDGKIGSNTRKVVGAYQRANQLKVDCWPTDGVLAHMRKTAAR